MNLTGLLEDSQTNQTNNQMQSNKKQKKPMKKQLFPILGVAGLALASLSAQAATPIFNYTDGDILLDFSASTGNSGTYDVEVDLGSLSGLNTLSGGSTVQVGNFSSQLTAAGLSLNNLAFSVFGIDNSVGTVWLSQTQLGASPIPAPHILDATSQAAVQSEVLGIAGSDGYGGLGSQGILPWSQNHAASANNTANTAIIKNTDANSFTQITGNSWSGAPSNPKTTTPATFTSGSVKADLFQFDPTGITSQLSVYDGYFTFNSNGTLDFTEFTAVPEPTTYGLLAGAGLLAVSVRNQLRRKQA